jgi:hypothetical protein
MAEPSEQNWSGVESFDHSGMPAAEYQALATSMNDMVQALRMSCTEVSQSDWLALARRMSAALAYADCCRRCGDSIDPAVFPETVAVAESGDRLRARYHCANGHRWDTGWAVNLPDIF